MTIILACLLTSVAIYYLIIISDLMLHVILDFKQNSENIKCFVDRSLL